MNLNLTHEPIKPQQNHLKQEPHANKVQIANNNMNDFNIEDFSGLLGPNDINNHVGNEMDWNESILQLVANDNLLSFDMDSDTVNCGANNSQQMHDNVQCDNSSIAFAKKKTNSQSMPLLHHQNPYQNQIHGFSDPNGFFEQQRDDNLCQQPQHIFDDFLHNQNLVANNQVDMSANIFTTQDLNANNLNGSNNMNNMNMNSNVNGVGANRSATFYVDTMNLWDDNDFVQQNYLDSPIV